MMDLETENRIAAILLKEAAEIRRQAEKEGVDVYLRQPKFRGRPNSRFLTATVLGVQQANRAVEVNEMWRVRQKELELDDMLRGKRRDSNDSARNLRDSKSSGSLTRGNAIRDNNADVSSCSLSKRLSETSSLREDEGLKDEELEKFLHSRAKRGRGTVGSRMDETGPYLTPNLESNTDIPTSSGMMKRQVVYGPEKPSSLRSYDSSEEESDDGWRKKAKKNSSDNPDSRKHRAEAKSKKKKRKEKKSKRHR